jgi:hypothetical protein
LCSESKAVPLRHAGAKGEKNYSSYSFLTSALDMGEWSASRPNRVSPGERSPDTHWIGGWVGFSAGLDTEARGKRLFLCRGSNPGCPVYSQWPCWLSYTPQTLLGGLGGQGLSRKREVINGYNMSVGNRDGKRRYGKRNRRWTDGTIMGLNRMMIAGIGCPRRTLYRGVSCQLSICVCVHWLGSCMAGELGCQSVSRMHLADIWSSGGLREHRIEFSGYVKTWEFRDHLSYGPATY